MIYENYYVLFVIIDNQLRKSKPFDYFLTKPKEIKNGFRRNSSKKIIGQRSSKVLIIWAPYHQRILSTLTDKRKSLELFVVCISL